MANLIYILGDQLSLEISSLQDFKKKEDVVLMTEVVEEANYVKHHKKKLIFIFSAMRNFADLLVDKGFKVHYVKLDDSSKPQSFIEQLEIFCKKIKPNKVIITEPSEYRVLKMFDDYNIKKNINLEIRSDNRFIASHHEFANYAKDKKKLLLENFYHLMRQKTGLLMENVAKKSLSKPIMKPVGGKWNYDQENRQTMPANVIPPKLPKISHNQNVFEVIAMVEKKFAKNFGSIDDFNYATTQLQAEKQFADFIKNRLANFGIYQDAMRQDVDFGFHSIISMYINIGLLNPLKCCQAVEKAYLQGDCDLASAEGFIRQIIGWREYIRAVYWFFMPKYAELNYFEHKNNLPEFYWDYKKTKMNCLSNVIKQTYDNAYSHHIQRLMITGNFALLAGIDPKQVNEWYLAVYADAFEWVELPNTHGMAIYADGGIVASKPYCSSGNYINKMSNFCKNCYYDVKQIEGEKACPFNFLYWNFLIKNEAKLKSNPRLFYPYSNLQRKPKKDLKIIEKNAENFLNEIGC